MEESHHHTATNIITHDSPYPIYALAFSPPSSPTPHLALGSFLEHPNSNRVDILSFNPSSLSLSPLPSLSFPHPFPPSKLMFSPHNPSLLASSSDFLRLHSLLSPSPSSPISTLNNSHSSDFSSPLTSFDWNDSLPSRLATSSIDTTCTIWDLDTESVETQLIAHDKEVYDVAWGEARVFASVSGDGSVRVFDLRDKEHSTIIYEDPETPLLRLAWNKRDLRYMATVGMDSGKVVVLDIRAPTVPVAELERHVAGVNAVAWAPQSGRHVCSVGDDGQALVWEVPGAGVGGAGVDPLSVFYAGEEINQVVWSGAVPDWIGIAFANKLQLLRV